MLEFIVSFTDKAAAEKFDRYHGTNGELVRCRDCSFFNTEYLNHDGMCECSGEFMENDDYCSLGERKDDNGGI